MHHRKVMLLEREERKRKKEKLEKSHSNIRIIVCRYALFKNAINYTMHIEVINCKLITSSMCIVKYRL